VWYGGGYINPHETPPFMSQTEENEETGGPDEERMGLGIAVGAALGVSLGLLMDDFALGIAIGLGAGIAIGGGLSYR
jgi:hypothetical protein